MMQQVNRFALLGCLIILGMAIGRSPRAAMAISHRCLSMAGPAFRVQVGQMKQQENPNLWACAACVIVISALFAAVPFWIRDIDLRDATIVSAIVFPTVAAVFTYAIWREWNQ
jgi:NhaP-type Na+/H+ and K+/H+ antiporter